VGANLSNSSTVDHSEKVDHDKVEQYVRSDLRWTRLLSMLVAGDVMIDV